MDEAYFNKPETEADGLRAGALRLLKQRHQSQVLTGRTHELLPLPSDTPPTTEPESSQEQTEEREAYSRMSELLKRRREG